MKKIIFFVTICSSLFAWSNITYSLKVIRPDINIDKNYFIIDNNFDNKFIINPKNIQNNNY